MLTPDQLVALFNFALNVYNTSTSDADKLAAITAMATLEQFLRYGANTSTKSSEGS